MKKILLILLFIVLFSCGKKSEDFIESKSKFYKNINIDSLTLFYTRPQFKRYVDYILQKKIFRQENTAEISLNSVFKEEPPLILVSSPEFFANSEKFLQLDYKIIMTPFLHYNNSGIVSGEKFSSINSKTKFGAIKNVQSEQCLKAYAGIHHLNEYNINYYENDDDIAEFLKDNPDSIAAVENVSPFKKVLLHSHDLSNNFPVLLVVKSEYLYLLADQLTKIISDILVINEDFYKLNPQEYYSKYKSKKEDFLGENIFPLTLKNNREYFNPQSLLKLFNLEFGLDDFSESLFYDKIILKCSSEKEKSGLFFREENNKKSLLMNRELISYELPYNRETNDFFQKAYFELYNMERSVIFLTDYEISVSYYPGANKAYSDYFFKEAYSKYYLNIYKKDYFTKVKFNYISRNKYDELSQEGKLPQNDEFIIKILLPELEN